MVVSDLTHYTVKERIGKGSFGEVNIVVQKQTGKQYVLKQVRLARQNEWQRAASHLEMQLARELVHPFIVPHFESWLDRGHTIQMVHEFCPRGDLHTMLQRLEVSASWHCPDSHEQNPPSGRHACCLAMRPQASQHN
jgi:serine/threonine protein kinase